MFRWISLLEEFGFDFKIEYQPGKENVVADALSRMQLNNINISNISATTWPEEFIKYLDPIDRNSLDDKVKNMLSKNEHNLRIVDEVIQFKNQYNLWVDYIPFVHRADLVFKHHHSLCHVGPDKIIESLERRCWWPSLKIDVRSWLKNCITCHRENAIPSCYEYIYIFLIKPSNRDYPGLYWNYKRSKRYPSLILSLLKHSIHPTPILLTIIPIRNDYIQSTENGRI